LFFVCFFVFFFKKDKVFRFVRLGLGGGGGELKELIQLIECSEKLFQSE